MNLSRLNANDCDKIADLYKGDFADGWSKTMLEDAFNANRFLVFGISDENNLVGVITCSTTLFDADIESVFIKKEFRKQGLASLLITELEKYLVNNSIEKIFLEVRAKNMVAQNLYVKHGFEKISQRKNYYSDGEDAVVMAKELKK